MPNKSNIVEVIVQYVITAVNKVIKLVYFLSKGAFNLIFSPQSNKGESVFQVSAAILRQSRLERLYAENLFNEVTDHDLLDHYVFLMLAAEKKYSFHIKNARMQN